MLHTGRTEYLLFNVVAVGFAAYLFNHMTQQRKTEIRVGEDSIGRISDILLLHCRCYVGEMGGFVTPHAVGEIRRQTRVMGHKVTWGDGAAIFETALNGKLWQITLQWLVNIQLALFSQLHHRGGGEEFGDGADTIDRLRHRFDLVRFIRIAKTL